jgi:hypothetical protein
MLLFHFQYWFVVMIQYDFLIVQFLVLMLVIDSVRLILNVHDQLQSKRFVPKNKQLNFSLGEKQFTLNAVEIVSFCRVTFRIIS